MKISNKFETWKRQISDIFPTSVEISKDYELHFKFKTKGWFIFFRAVCQRRPYVSRVSFLIPMEILDPKKKKKERENDELKGRWGSNGGTLESGRSLGAGEFPWWCATVKLNSVHYLISLIWIMPATWITLNCLNYFVNGAWTTTAETNRGNAIHLKPR